MSDLERQLAELFMSDSRSRRVDQVSVNAPRQNRFGGPVFVGGVAMAALALIVAFSLIRGGPQNVPASSPTPSGSAGVVTSPGPSASAAPSVSSRASASAAPSTTTGAARPDSQHGVITRGGPGGIVRTESDPAPLASMKPIQQLAVTKDGRRVAYVYRGAIADQLIVFDAAKPDVQKTLIDFQANEIAGGLVWSSDANDEVLIQVDKRSQTPPGVDSSSLRAVNVDTGALREIVRITTAQLLPIVWHASTNTGGAVETGDGGFAISYDYISGGTLKRSPLQQGQVGAFAVRADADGKRVLALSGFAAPPRGVTWWPFDKFEEKRDLKPSEGWDVSAAFWRAGTDEIVVFASPTVKGAPGPAPRIEAWTTSDQRRTVAEATGPLATLRTDGTAAITTNWNVVDLTTGAITAMPPGDAAQTPQWAVRF